MPSSADRTRVATETVHRYIDLLVTGTSADLAALYATDATLEDPVGTEVRVGRRAIGEFYATLDGLQRDVELVTLRVSGGEAAFHFRLTVTAADGRMRIEPIDIMAFDDDGKITAMRAYWSPENVTAL